MLVITRTAKLGGPGSSFSIGQDITVHILSAVGDNVRIGIEAPKELPILRDDAKNKTPYKGV